MKGLVLLRILSLTDSFISEAPDEKTPVAIWLYVCINTLCLRYIYLDLEISFFT